MNKKVGLTFLSFLSLLGVATIVVTTNSSLVARSSTTEYTINLSGSNAFQGGAAGKDIKTALGNEIYFQYSSCYRSNVNAHTRMSQNSFITNTNAIHYITSVYPVFSGSDLYVSFSEDSTNWTSEVQLTSDTEYRVTTNQHYIKLISHSGCELYSARIKFGCTQPGDTVYDVSSYYDGYYSSLEEWSDGEDLKQQLYDLMRTNYNPLPYDSPNWETNQYADHTPTSYLKLDALYTATDVDASLTNKGWQREHAFCASLMTDSLTSAAVKYLGRSTDFHNLIAGEASGNMSRGNKNYGEADTTSATYTDRTTGNGYDGYSFDPQTFEPGDKDKGRVARAIFYMATMHKEDELDTVNNKLMKGLTVVEGNVNYSSGNCQFAHGNLSTLLNWAATYAPDRLEMQHNISVQKHVLSLTNTAQGNRNPYIDYPELVDYAFGSKKDQPGRLDVVRPAAEDLDCNSSEHAYYCLKSAPQTGAVGSFYSKTNIVLLDVAKDFTETAYTDTSYSCSLNAHQFTNSDPNPMTCTLTIGEEVITYPVTVEGMTVCSFYHEMKFTTSSVSGGLIKDFDEHTYTWGGISFKGKITLDGTKTSGCVNKTDTDGGCVIGSGTIGAQLRSMYLETVDEYSIDQVYFKGKGGNASSTDIKMKIYVGEDLIYDQTIYYTTTASAIYGGTVDSSLTGKIRFEFEGQTSLRFSAFAFNVVA